MEEHGIKLKNFHQVDKQGLVMDVIGAFQAHTDNFITHAASPHTTRSVAVSTAHTDQTMVSSGSAGDGGRSGNVLLRSGGGFQTGNVEVSTGQAIKTAGALKLNGGASLTGPGGQVQMIAGSSKSEGGGSVVVGGGTSLLRKGGDAQFGSGVF